MVEEESKPKTETEEKPKAVDPIQKAIDAAERLEKANQKAEEIAIRLALGGKSEAGEPLNGPEPLSDKDYAKKVMSGEVKYD